MTAEILIMNNKAVALAADSAVSAMVGTDRKIFTTADKIFVLSPNRPVGVMIYNNVHFLGVPWETLIYEISKRIPESGFDTLDEYIQAFLGYFETEKDRFPKGEQRILLKDHIEFYFSIARELIVRRVDDELKRRPLNDRAIKILVSKVIKDDLDDWAKHEVDE
ncbi:unnamed protein product, partial [marine sediment metagenome]